MPTDKKTISTVFLGTNQFAAKVLTNILLDSSIKIRYCITKKDKKVGRGGVLSINPIAKIANTANIPVIQVDSLVQNPSQLDSIDFSKIDLGLVVSFAYIIPYDILRQVKKGFINLHPSMLPMYRGPAPITNSIINNEDCLGITIMLLDEGMDTGPILTQKQIDINSTMVYPQIEEIVIKKGTIQLIDTAHKYINNRITPKPQDNLNATITKYVKKEDGYVSLSEEAIHIYNKWRAFYTWPGIYTTVLNLEEYLGFKLKVEDKSTIIKIKELVLNPDQKLTILKLQLPNKPVISYNDFVNGYKL